MVKNRFKRSLRTSVLMVAFIAGSTVSHAADQQNFANSLSDALSILLGAYNGAVQAAAENGGTSARIIDRHELQSLEDTVNRYQNDLRGIVQPDGKIDTQHLGQLLNRLQNDSSGQVNYDFIQALSALNELSSDDGLQGFLNQQVISQLVGAAKNPELNRELSQAAPYVATILQLGSLMNQQGNHPDSGALSAEVQRLKTLAARYQAQPNLAQDIASITAQLKILYADQVLGNTLNLSTFNQVQQQLVQLQERVVMATPQTVPVTVYDELLRLLGAFGQPFAEQLAQWQNLRTNSINATQHITSSNNGFDAPTRKLLDALNYNQLPPHIQRELLERLNISIPQ